MIKKPNFIQILIGVFISKFINPFFKKEIKGNIENYNIGEYKLVLPIYKKDIEDKYYTGIYKRNNKKFFIKTWQGKFKDYFYYSIINEYVAVNLLNEKINLIQDNKNIKIPKIVNLIKGKNKFSIIYEYIEGKPLKNLNKKEVNENIYLAENLFNKISFVLSTNDKKTIMKRTKYFYLLLMPFFSVLLIFYEPKEIKLILKALFTSLSSHTFYENKLFLAHRDMQPDNFIVTNNYIYLLDYEQIVLTIPGYDMAYFTVESFEKSINKNIDNALLNFITMHQGSGWNISTLRRKKYIKFLRKINNQ